VPFARESIPHDSDSGARALEPSRPSMAEIGSSVADDRIGQEAAAHRVALAALVDRVLKGVDQGALAGELSEALAQSVERAIGEQAAALQADGDVGANISKEMLARDARAELTAFGPLSEMLDDPEVNEIVVSRYDRISATRAGRHLNVEPPFSSEASLRLALSRLCRLAGAGINAQERVVERRLPNGARLSAVLAPIGQVGTLIVVRKPRRSATSLDELVRRGTISRAIATFLGHLVAARANVLVVGPRGSGVPNLVSALAAAAANARLIAVQDLDELVSAETAARLVPTDPAEAARLVQVAARTPDARLVVDLVSPEVASATIEAIGEGADGVIAALRAPSLRRGLSRLTGEVATMRPGTTPVLAREWIAGAFDVALEVSRLRDGRYRALRVAELSAAGTDELQAQDVFTFMIERTAAGGAVEGTFIPSGIVPRIVEELSARGIAVESSLFTRPPSR